jgi:hypothetical protein
MSVHGYLSGLQTVAPESANKGHFGLTFHANKRRPRLTIAANEPAFGSCALLVMLLQANVLN